MSTRKICHSKGRPKRSTFFSFSNVTFKETSFQREKISFVVHNKHFNGFVCVFFHLSHTPYAIDTMQR